MSRGRFYLLGRLSRAALIPRAVYLSRAVHKLRAVLIFARAVCLFS